MEFNFVDEYEKKYYLPENKVIFVNIIDGKKVNKYWLGTSLLMSPFFIAAHVLATVLNLPNDGYSFIYQMMIAIAACFYLLLGLYFIRRFLLLFDLKEFEIFIALFTLVFATNLFYYTVAEPSMSHVYSFAGISGFVFFTKKFFKTLISKYLVYVGLFFGIVVLIRPSNGIVLLIVPFLAESLSDFSRAINKTGIIKTLTFSVPVLMLLSMQFAYYKNATGNYYIYSYGDEKFYFLKPHIVEFLFSYRRGLFVYAPVLLISLLGFIFYSRVSRFQTFGFLLFLLFVFYFLSSWWMWYYGGGFGMRPVIDYLVFFALPMTFLIQFLMRGKILKWVGFCCIGACVLVSQIQTYQKVNFILPWDGVNKEIYWKLFLNTDKEFIGKYKVEPHAQ